MLLSMLTTYICEQVFSPLVEITPKKETQV